MTLSAASGQTVSVNYATAPGTATAPGDYLAVPLTTLTFAPGETTKPVTVTVNGDTLIENNETFNVNLSGVVNATLTNAQGVGTIVNDDFPAISINDVSLPEGNTGTSNATFTVSLSAAAPFAVTVQYATANGTATAGSDYTTTNGTLTFAPGGALTQTVSVPVTGDTVVENNETVLLNLSAPTNAILADNQGVGTIVNDDFSTISINSVSILEGNLGDANKPLNFTVTLSQASTNAVTVKYTTADTNATTGKATAGKDYVATSGTLTIPAGQTTGVIAVPIIGDNLNEDSETFFLNLSVPTNATIAVGQGVGTIIDNDALPILSSSNITVTEGTGGTKTADFTINLNAVSGRNVSFTCNTADGTAKTPSDYTATRVNLTIPAGQTTAKFRVPIITDSTDEYDENFYAFLTLPVNAKISTTRVQCTITDDDAPPTVSIDNATAKEYNGGKSSAIFHLKLSAISGKVVTVNFATAAGTTFPATAGIDYEAVPSATVSISAGSLTGIARVVILGDTLDEENETYKVNLSSPVNATLAAAPNSQGIGTVLDDDAAPSLSIDDVSITEGNSGTKNLKFTVSLSAVSAKTISVNYTTADGTARSSDSDYGAANGTLVFTVGITTRTINVVITGDTKVEGNETLSLLLSGANKASIGRARGVGTILNDDASG